MKTKSIITLSISLFLSLHGFTQLNAAKDMLEAKKKEKRIKQIESSAASNEIKKIEKLISGYDNSFKSSSYWDRLKKDDYVSLETELAEAEALIPVIKEKDAKWAEKNDYTGSLAGHKKMFDEKYTAFKKANEKEEAKAWLTSKYWQFRGFFMEGGVHYMGHQYTSMIKVKVYENFQYEMQQIDFQGTKTRFAEIMKMYPDLNTATGYKELTAFYEKEFPEFINGPELEFIEKVKKECAEKFMEARNMCYSAMADLDSYIKDVLVIYPDNAAYKNMQTQVQTLKKEFDDYMDKNIYTSEFHKNHVGKMLFSNKPIVVGKEKEEDFKTTFTAGESVYAIIYFNTVTSSSFNYLFGMNASYSFEGEFSASGYGEKEKSGTYFTFAIIPDPAIAEPVSYSAFRITENILSATKKTGFGEKKVKVLLNRSTDKNGSDFEIDYSTGVDAFEAKVNKIRLQRAAAVRIPKGTAASAEVLGLWNKVILEPGETTREVRMYGGWEYEKNRLTGIILSRSVRVWGVIKRTDGSCVMFGGDLVQQRGENGSYGQPYLNSESTLHNIDGTTYDSGRDGVKRSWGEDGYQCDCNLVGK